MVELNESVNPKVIRLNGYRQFCELLALLCLSVGACGLLLLPGAGKLWTAGALLVSLFFLKLALFLSRKAILEFKYGEFSVTPPRLFTLQATRAPRDLMQCLNGLTRNRFRGEQNYFRHLSKTLPPARCADLKDMIFKYTYVGLKKDRG